MLGCGSTAATGGTASGRGATPSCGGIWDSLEGIVASMATMVALVVRSDWVREKGLKAYHQRL